MAEPFIGELKLIGFSYPPKGWAFCNGQILSINQNQALFSLLGTYFGGNGQTTFALPDLRGRIPMHVGGGWNHGSVVGEETHTLTIPELPAHAHFAQATTTQASVATPTGNSLASSANMYTAFANPTQIGNATVGLAGGSQPHENRQPYLTLAWIIALIGIFPSRN
jgi:microcystin-dependent protein